MRHVLFIIFGVLIMATAPLSVSAQTPLPNQPANAEANADGVRMMVNWSVAKVTTPIMNERETPNNPAFAGAELWVMKQAETDPIKAALSAFSKAGFAQGKEIAKTPLSPDALDVLDSDPKAQGYAVMLEGTLNGQPAHGIALVLYGSVDGLAKSSTVHAFMAPKDKFVALGGFSIAAAKWLNASAAPNEDMTIEGSLSPQAATNRLSLFFSQWVQHYVIPMMGLSMQMQMQSIQNMQSWNNSMNACDGGTSCTVIEDGSGGWTTTPD